MGNNINSFFWTLSWKTEFIDILSDMRLLLCYLIKINNALSLYCTMKRNLEIYGICLVFL